MHQKDDNISAETREHVLSIAKQYNYVPAQSLTSPDVKTMTLGVILKTLKNPAPFLSGILEAANRAGYFVMVCAFISEQHMNDRFYTNSDYMINNLLLHSDVCCLGIDIVPAGYRKYGIKALKIEDCEPFLAFGFVAAENASLSAEAEQYLGKLKTYLQ